MSATNRAENNAVPPSLTLPGRVAFRTRHWFDSVFWIRDTKACELQNRGDMLILRPNGTFISAHCDYLFDEEKTQINTP